MIDAKQLLDQFMGARSGAPQAGSQTSVPSTGQASQGAGDLMSKARDFLGGNQGLVGGAAAGALTSLLLGSKSGRRLAGNAVAVGGLALVGTLAYKAYRNYQQGQPVPAAPAPAPAQLPPPDSPFAEARVIESGLPITLVRTMIAASMADGHIDERERAAVSAKFTEGGHGGEIESFLAGEIGRPASVETLAAGATTPEAAAEIYMCALLAIDPDTTAERTFLARLAAALKLDPALVPHLDAAARSAKVEMA